jgi:hypothetical protein
VEETGGDSLLSVASGILVIVGRDEPTEHRTQVGADLVVQGAGQVMKSQPAVDVLLPKDKMDSELSEGVRHLIQMPMAIPMNPNRLLNLPSPRRGQR